MKEKDFVEIESAGFELGFYAGLFGTDRYDGKAVKKAKRKLLRLQKRYLTSEYSGQETPNPMPVKYKTANLPKWKPKIF